MGSELEDAFHEVGSHLDYPMFIVTTASQGRRAGCLVGFTTQCTINPPRFVAFISDKNYTHRVALEASHLAVHVVPEDRQDLASLFGEITGDDVDKFERCTWEPGPEGVPLLPECPDRFVGRIADRFDSGDHTGFFLEPISVEAGGGGFFSFQRAMELEPGHEA
ncbi:MAG: flavin reductase family protein [Actinomycetota bacterium]|nr:flavin reductase family protein [Actinomycetota bacterium]